MADGARRRTKTWSAERQAAFLANIFPAARAAVENPATFSWHMHAASPHSSQALAIDVFGTIKVSGHADTVLSALARRLGLPDEGPWQSFLEWFDPRNGLAELTVTQVDAAAVGQRAIILFECKFTEAGGSCSQPKSGACSGKFTMQTNPQNGVPARCALSGKKIRYWDHIPEIYGIDPELDHSPCPFRWDAFQWMRNSVLANSLAFQEGKQTRVAAIYADAPFLQTALKVQKGPLGLPTLTEAHRIIPLSYQDLIDLCAEAAPDGLWGKLRAWVDAKIEQRRP